MSRFENDASPIEGWEERFPFPESLDNPEFIRWAFALDRNSQLKVANRILRYHIQLDEASSLDDIINRFLKFSPNEDKRLIAKADTLIGILTVLKKEHDWFPGLSAKYNGELLRIATEVLIEAGENPFQFD